MKGPSDLSVTLTTPPDATVGNPFPATIKIANHGLSTATSVGLTVTLPAGVTFVSSSLGPEGCSGTETIACRVGSISNGSEATIEMHLMPAAEDAR